MALSILQLYNKGLSSGKTYSGPVASGTNPDYFRATGQSIPTYNPPKPQVLGSNTFSGGGNIPSAPTQNNPPYQQITDAQNNGNSQIDSDYESAMGMLGNAESGLQQQATNAGNVIDTGASDVSNQITNEQATATTATNTSLQTGESQAKQSAMAARDLFRQTQQSNNAQLSALGISSSSVSEALAERLGVETARRIAGIDGNLSNIRQNAVNELGRIKNYYQGQLTTLTKHVADQKATIQASLVQGLNQINSARSQAASAKAQARANLLSQVQSQIYQLTTQQQQFEQSLQQWQAQKTAALTPIASDPGWVDNFAADLARLQADPKNSQFNISGQVDQNAKGQYTGSYNFGAINTNTKKTTDDEDELAALRASLGL